MFSHVAVGTNDLARARHFYSALLGVLGYEGAPLDTNAHVYSSRGGFLKIALPINGEPATPGNGATIGFLCADPNLVELWHAVGLAHGGRAIEDPPGIRHSPFGPLYLAYLRDPDGNKLCAFHRVSTD
jgi:catechol 2,3-dioxygenase-like lactoylglutathione lyase family enzyme